MRDYGLGRALPRNEDFRLLRDRGCLTDDILLPNTAHLWVQRSPHAVTKIGKIDIAEAKSAPDVIATLTGADAVSDGLGSFASFVPRP